MNEMWRVLNLRDYLGEKFWREEEEEHWLILYIEESL
jgi:hypothetical protein